jgi:adenosine deaminase/adenosine deaminase CECR1
VFASLFFATELQRADDRVVGLNIVAPEDNPGALRDYDLHMQMLDFLWRQHPETRISLHAGELTLGLVKPSNLRSHIRSAIEIGHAARIGHGVSIGYEDDAFGLLRLMAERSILVEINLTSNEQILGQKNDDHPFPDYLSYDVPVALSTDDQGIARSDLTNEYAMAARRYSLTYNDLKKIARNSVTFSFLPGSSIWKDAATFARVAECEADKIDWTSEICNAYLRSSPKAKEQWRLEAGFLDFERRYGASVAQVPRISANLAAKN